MAITLLHCMASYSTAKASYSFMDGLKTVGIATGTGIVLGLSTLPFYDKPPASNIILGGGVGLIVGVGLAAYFMSTSSDEVEDIGYDELIIPKKVDEESKKPIKENSPSVKPEKKSPRGQQTPGAQLGSTSVLATLVQRQPQQWVVALEVLELRF